MIPKMAERLRGAAFRVFRSLLREWDLNTAEDIRVQLTCGPVASIEEIEAALEELTSVGYVEAFTPGRWRVTPQGQVLKRSRLGLPRDR